MNILRNEKLKILPQLFVLVLLSGGVLVSSYAPLHVQHPPCSVFLCPPASTTTLAHITCSVALLKPIFTATAYSSTAPNATWHDFYDFYGKYTQKVTEVLQPNPDLQWLNLNISLGMRFNGGWGGAYPIYQYLNSNTARANGLIMGQNLCVLTDLDLNNGALFRSNGSLAYRTLIMGHTEYVTYGEMQEIQRFIGDGGKLVAMDSNSFYVDVNYNSTTSVVSLGVGHFWVQNSSGAYIGPSTPWADRTTDFMSEISGEYQPYRIDHGGAQLNTSNSIGEALRDYFNTSVVFKSYSLYGYDNDYVENFTNTSMVGIYLNMVGMPICYHDQPPYQNIGECSGPYVHNYRNGVVIGTCIIADSVFANDPQLQKFLLLAIAYSSEHQ